jgi:hypothetical protein
MFVTKTAEMPGFHLAPPTPMGPILGPSEGSTLDPLLYTPPALPWSEKLKPHLLWILPTLIFGSVFISGLIWILRPDPPLPVRAPALPPPPSVSVVETAAPRPPPEEPAAPPAPPVVQPRTRPRRR